MGIATFVEKYKGSDFVANNIYGSWWFVALWALLVAASVIWIVKQRMKRWSLLCSHFSLLLILSGALLSKLTAERGLIHLRTGQADSIFICTDKAGNTLSQHRLPFSIRLKQFDIDYYHGTRAAADYQSSITIIDGKKQTNGHVSMNKIMSYKSFRIYQNAFDEDQRGSILAINTDPWGIPVTYTGYALLFMSLIWMMADPKGTYRKLLKSTSRRLVASAIVLAVSVLPQCHAANTLPKDAASQFGKLYILNNDRICQMQTFAINFTNKIHGSSRYNGLNAEQIITGWLFWGEEWNNEPFIKIKSGPLKDAMQLPDYMPLASFFNRDMGGYILGPHIMEYQRGNNDKFHRQVAELDGKIQLLMELRRGTLCKVFPYTNEKETVWYAPTDNISTNVKHDDKLYMQNVFALLYSSVTTNDTARTSLLIDKMQRYQQKNGGLSLPSHIQDVAERLYNKIPFATILFMLNLSMGLISLFVEIRQLAKSGKNVRKQNWSVGVITMALSFASLTFCEALRWIVSGNIPMSNGYETMLFMAWLVMLVSMASYRYFRIALSFGFLMSGFFLLVSHINEMDPAITNMMPVLNSPLLSIHVSIIMMSFALLSLTFVCGVAGLVTKGISSLCKKDTKTTKTLDTNIDSLHLLSRLLLYPALAALGIGIFVGAIWANVSWGQYWGWDPKEVWALITFMIYAISVHTSSLPVMRNPTVYHAFMTLAFLTIVMTYFGVNYFLGGMHSYA